MSNSAVAEPGETGTFPPVNTCCAVPALIAAFISVERVAVSPRSAMSLMPSVAIAPSRQKLTCELCVPPTSGEKCAEAGKSTGCVAAAQVAWNVARYRAATGAATGSAVGVVVFPPCDGAVTVDEEHAAQSNAAAKPKAWIERVRVMLAPLDQVVLDPFDAGRDAAVSFTGAGGRSGSP